MDVHLHVQGTWVRHIETCGVVSVSVGIYWKERRSHTQLNLCIFVDE